MPSLRAMLEQVDLRRLVSPRYQREFDLVQQRADYRRIPQSVLMDLAEFCGAADPLPADGDLYKLGTIKGRLDVWRRIQQHLCLSEAEVYALLMGKPFTKAEEWYRAGMV